MKFFARVIDVITSTGGSVFDVVTVEATYGADAVAQISKEMQVEEWLVYLITEEEAMQWAALEIPIREICPKF